MPRIAEVPSNDPRTENPYVKYMYKLKFGDQEFVTAPGNVTGVTGNAETCLAQVPDLMEQIFRGFAFFFSPDRVIKPILRELSVVRAAWATGSQFVFSQHCKVLRAVGATEQQITDITSWQVSDAYTEAQRAVLAYSDCLSLSRGRVPDSLFATLKRHLSEPEILELTHMTMMYIHHAIMIQALRLEYDDRDDPITEIPAPNGFVLPAPGPMILPED